jgi:hypothetical protein
MNSRNLFITVLAVTGWLFYGIPKMALAERAITEGHSCRLEMETVGRFIRINSRGKDISILRPAHDKDLPFTTLNLVQLILGDVDNVANWGHGGTRGDYGHEFCVIVWREVARFFERKFGRQLQLRLQVLKNVPELTA